MTPPRCVENIHNDDMFVIVCCDVYYSLRNTEEALALSVEQLHGYSVNVTITENHKQLPYSVEVISVTV